MPTTIELLYKKLGEQPHKFSTYLSMKNLGKECERDQWLTFRWATKTTHEGRIKRLFKAGLNLEDKLTAELRSIGCIVIDRGANGKQEFLRGEGYLTHLVGAIDVTVRNMPEAPDEEVLGDYKSANDKNFKLIVKDGMKAVYPYYVTQLIMYLGYKAMKKGFIMTENKNNSELDMQWFDFDPEVFEDLKHKAYRIITSDRPTKREFSRGVYNSPCKFCDNQAVCYGEAIPEVNCRTCIHSTPTEEGKWKCGLKNVPLSYADQALSCEKHLFIPEILEGYEALHGSDDSITYMQKKRKIIVINVVKCDSKQPNEYDSLELKAGKHEEENPIKT